MECALAHHFGYRQNLIVPNVHWGMNMHECDLLVISKAGYASEVEIKVTKADLKKDAEKAHEHDDPRIKSLWFAIPDYLEDSADLVPDRAGIIVVDTAPIKKQKYQGRTYTWQRRCKKLRPPQMNGLAQPFSAEDRFKVARLGALRVWRLKEKLTVATAEKGHDQP